MRSIARGLRLSLFLLIGLSADSGMVIGSGSQEASAPEIQESLLPPPAPAEVDFSEQVLPILEGNCIHCHGSALAMGGFRLHTRDDLLRGGDNGPAVVPGSSSDSRLVHLVAGGGKLRMPLEGDPLSDEQVGILRAWIDQGVPWLEDMAVSTSDASDPGHWSFRQIRDPLPPEVRNGAWLHNPIDNFILSRLEREDLEPSPEADRATLIRRLHLDLLGLPPTPSALELFLNDRRPYAYKRLVNRVLASPHFGERWARHWLDLARYADSDGFEKDRPRPHAWRYREWVINAYNRDLPYDQFVLEQLAGDLLPGPTDEQRVATGFHRNTLTNAEGGVDPEQYRVEQVVDRTDTTGVVFMGLTMGCARCHSHKYDPISQREYYQMFAFFNSGVEKNIPAPLPREEEAYRRAARVWTEEQKKLVASAHEYRKELLEEPAAAESVARWEEELDHTPVEWIDLDPSSFLAIGGARFTREEDGSLVVSGNNPEKDRYTLVATTSLRDISAVRIDFSTHASLPAGGPGRAPDGNFVLSEVKITDSHLAEPTYFQEVPLERALASHSQKGFEIGKAIDGDEKTGWSVGGPLGPNRHHQAVFVTGQSLGNRSGSAISITLEQLHGKGLNIGSLRVFVTRARRQDLKRVFPMAVERALAIPPGDRTPQQQATILDYYVSRNPELKQHQAAVQGHRRARPVPPATMAQTIASNSESLRTHVLERGNFLREGEEVTPGTLSVLPRLQVPGREADRLDLALWLTDQSHPLTARVEVNRLWEHLFGRGLVASSEDFGSRGEKPSHPLLLDWLAGEFMRRGWSRKELIRLILTSATYRQESRSRPELEERDPQNALLARQNRFRVESEVTRDLHLAVGGLLEPRIGGPSIRPPLPEGFQELAYDGMEWPESSGTEKYRRSLYIFFQRSVPYPMLMTFDAPDSTTSCVRRNRSNTPLQALTLLNGPLFVESARAFGGRLLQEAPGGDSQRIRHAFRLALAREPDPGEEGVVRELVDDYRGIFGDNPDAAAEYVGSDHSGAFSETEMAAWVAAGRMILNLDEFLTRE